MVCFAHIRIHHLLTVLSHTKFVLGVNRPRKALSRDRDMYWIQKACSTGLTNILTTICVTYTPLSVICLTHYSHSHHMCHQCTVLGSTPVVHVVHEDHAAPRVLLVRCARQCTADTSGAPWIRFGKCATDALCQTVHWWRAWCSSVARHIYYTAWTAACTAQLREVGPRSTSEVVQCYIFMGCGDKPLCATHTATQRCNKQFSVPYVVASCPKLHRYDTIQFTNFISTHQGCHRHTVWHSIRAAQVMQHAHTTPLWMNVYVYCRSLGIRAVYDVRMWYIDRHSAHVESILANVVHRPLVGHRAPPLHWVR